MQPTFALGFLVVGVSSLVGPIVEWNEWTNAWFSYLRPTSQIQWVPQGMFMTFYGFFGFFLFGPIQWYINFENRGAGIIEINGNTKRFVIVRDKELVYDIKFSEIEKVVLDYNELLFATQEIYLVLKDNSEVHFMEEEKFKNLGKRILERRGAQLARLIDVEY